MVHHVRAEGDDIVPASADKTKEEPNQEHMFGFIYGFDGKQMKRLLTTWSLVGKTLLVTTQSQAPVLLHDSLWLL